jgi:CRISPR-associated protein Csm4
MTRKCYQLSFIGPLHLSAGGFALESIETFLRSDTLYSALCATAASYWGGSSLADFFFPSDGQVSPRFRLSSGFPYFQDVFFLPKPFFYSSPPGVSSKDEKRLRQVSFVDSLLWQEIISGKGETLSFHEEASDPCLGKSKAAVQASSVVNGCWTNRALEIEAANLHPEEKLLQEKNKMPLLAARFFEEIERPRVTVDRVSSAATIFHFSELIFRRGAGLYFLADFEREADIPAFEALLTMLGELGMGADRTVGRGQFEWKSIDPPLSYAAPAGADAFISLALFVPDEEDLAAIDFEASWYDYTLRRGWVSQRELRRRAFRMFAEGSAFKVTRPEQPLRGKLLKALKQGEGGLNHDVWRSGLCFPVPAILPVDNH